MNLRSTSNSQTGNDNENSPSSSHDTGTNLNESLVLSDSCDKLSRKRKAESETSQNDISIDTNDESTPSNMSKHSRRVPHDPDSPPFDWQSTKPSLKDRSAYIFEQELFCDVHFIVGQGPLAQKMSANKTFLSMGSAVFDAMFSGDWSSSEPRDIEVPDVEPAAFSSLLRYLYTDDVSISPDTVMAILYAAKKYAVPSLEAECRDFLLSSLIPENAFSLLTQTRSFDEEDLVNSCLEEIDTNADEAFASDCFTDISTEELCEVLARNTLEIREIQLFKAVCRWCKAELVRRSLPETLVNQRTVLERVLPLVRYPLMTAKEVYHTVVPSGLLLDSQLVSLYGYLSVNPKPPIHFNCTPRGIHKYVTVKRFETNVNGTGWHYTEGVANVIGFCCDQDVLFAGYGLYGPLGDTTEYDMSVALVNTVTGEVVYEKSRKRKLWGSGVWGCYRSNRVKLWAHTNYTLRFHLQGPPTSFGQNGKDEVTVDMKYGGQLTVSFNTVGDVADENTTCVSQGQIPALLFSFY